MCVYVSLSLPVSSVDDCMCVRDSSLHLLLKPYTVGLPRRRHHGPRGQESHGQTQPAAVDCTLVCVVLSALVLVPLRRGKHQCCGCSCSCTPITPQSNTRTPASTFHTHTGGVLPVLRGRRRVDPRPPPHVHVGVETGHGGALSCHVIICIYTHGYIHPCIRKPTQHAARSRPFLNPHMPLPSTTGEPSGLGTPRRPSHHRATTITTITSRRHRRPGLAGAPHLATPGATSGSRSDATTTTTRDGGGQGRPGEAAAAAGTGGRGAGREGAGVPAAAGPDVHAAVPRQLQDADAGPQGPEVGVICVCVWCVCVCVVCVC